MQSAPYFADIANGPEGGQAWWVHTEDNTRLRIGMWAAQNQEPEQQTRGTVLLFPGRTEFIEKYGHLAQEFGRAGYTTLTLDWRGQGLSDRLLSDPMPGHVLRFSDYQQDVSAFLRVAEELDLPRPWHLFAHSMGGCIGIRALTNNLDVTSCVFSGPMWGIRMSDTLRPFAWGLSWISRYIGMGHAYAPSTSCESYVLIEPFETNKLTCDRDMYQFMIDQMQAQPKLALAGPSLNWLYEALCEMRALSRLPSPDLPCLTILGSDEDIVDPARIHDRMRRWPSGHLELFQGGRHEVLMDSPQIRGPALQQIISFYSDASRATTDLASQPVADAPAL